MKRIISWVLLAVMMLSLFAGCGTSTSAPAADPTNAPAAAPADEAVVADENLENAIAYLKAYYKTVRDGDLTPSDFERLGSVRVGLTAYEVVYTVDCDESAVKVVKGDNGLVTIDVNEDSEVEVPYSLTATITGTDGKTASLTWKHVLPISMASRSLEIIDAAYALEDGEALPYEVTLKGEVISVDTPYSPDYKNITVSIKVAGREDKPIMCYRLKGDGCENLLPGDIITVTGNIKNYKGTIEFDAGCLLISAEKGENSFEIPTDPQEILEAAFALKGGEALPYQATLTGKIIGIKTAYSEQYGNISVVIRTGEPWYDITCYRMKGEDVDKIGRDDIITVTGILKNYGGHTIEFDTGSLMVDWVDKPDPQCPEDPAEIMKQAQKLNNGASLPYYCYLTGEVTNIRTKWNPVNGYARLSISVAGTEVDCYRLRGDDIENVKVGDTITVWGKIEKYQGAIQIYSAQLIGPKDASLVDDLYNLKAGETIADAQLTGKITSIDKPYSGSSVTVTMTVEGKKNKPVQCVNLTGLGAELLEVGDTIEVAGTLTNNAGSYQFASGCKLMSWTNANLPKVDNHSSNEEVLAAAALLGTGQRIVGVCLEGTITQVNTAYNSRYGNVTVTMSVNGQSVRCNRLGENKAVEKLGVGDKIKVYGKLWKNNSGNLEFQNDCGLVSYTLYEKPEQPAAGSKITLAQALALGATDNKVRVTGTITSIENTKYGNMYISDGTGTLYIYGAYDEAKNRYDAMPNKPVVGGTYTFYGPIVTYNSTVEMKDATVEGLTSGGGEGGGTELTGLAKDLDDASKLANKAYLDRTTTITGTISNTPKASSYTAGQYDFTVNVGGTSVRCYFVPVSGGTPKQGDTVTVTGNLTAYNGSPQFDSKASATLSSGGSGSELTGLAKDLDDASKLANKEYLDRTTTITGTISNTPKVSSYNANQFDFTVNVGGTNVRCYFVPVSGGTPKQGDTVTVTGNLTAYNGSPQFDSKASATLAGGSAPEIPEVDASSPLADIVAAVKAGAVLDFNVTVSGTVKAVYTNGDGTKNIPIITSAGQINCNNVADNGSDGWDNVAAGDTVTMTGKLTLKSGTTDNVRINGATLVSHTPATPACTHENTTTTVTATCTEAGKTTVTCECGEVIDSTDTAALGHDWSNKDGKCARSGCEATCEHSETETVNTATCGAAGKETVTCKNCGKVISETDKEATGAHSYVEGTCGVCGGADPDYTPAPEGGEGA